jgi:chloramphenicol-sensitive protein RarD
MMIDNAPESAAKRSRDGIFSALIAYVMWGFLPIYFIVVKAVPAFEVLSHRIIWAVPFGALIIAVRGQWSEVRGAIANRTTLSYLAVTAVLIAGNWLVYVFAVQAGQILQASLGYYITPMLFALVGIFVLGEQLRKQQVAAIGLAGIGVAVLAVSGGTFPVIAIFLGITFTIYGVLRKKVVVGAMPGLFVETIVLLPFALSYLAWQVTRGDATFIHGGAGVSWLLTLAGPLTVVPLVFFALAAKRLMLATIGMMQFIGPTIQFFIGLINGERLTTAHIICFVCIWGAAVVFSLDAWGHRRPKKEIVT